MKRFPGYLHAAAMMGMMAAAGPAEIVAAEPRPEPKPKPATRRIVPRGAIGSIAQGNRWTGKPHEHRREIARGSRIASTPASVR